MDAGEDSKQMAGAQADLYKAESAKGTANYVVCRHRLSSFVSSKGLSSRGDA